MTMVSLMNLGSAKLRARLLCVCVTAALVMPCRATQAQSLSDGGGGTTFALIPVPRLTPFEFPRLLPPVIPGGGGTTVVLKEVPLPPAAREFLSELPQLSAIQKAAERAAV